MVLLLQNYNASPFFAMGIKTEFNQSCGHCFSSQILVQSLWKNIMPASPDYLISSAVTSSSSGLFPVFKPLIASLTSARSGGGSSPMLSVWKIGADRTLFLLYKSLQYSFHRSRTFSPSQIMIPSLSLIASTWALSLGSWPLDTSLW